MKRSSSFYPGRGIARQGDQKKTEIHIAGSEACQKRIKEAKFLPVVILTYSAEQRILREACRLGVNSYIVKPAQFDNYVAKVGSMAFYRSVVNENPF